MESPIGGMSGFAKIEQIFKKFEQIREALYQTQKQAPPAAEQSSFRSALNDAVERQSKDGKTNEPAQRSSAPARSDGPAQRASRDESGRRMNAETEKRLMDTLRRELPKYNVPPDLALAVMQAESGFNPAAVSPKGAVGVMQLMPRTAANLGVDDADDLYEPEVNIPTGLQYLSNLLNKYAGDESKALAAYNAGPGAVAKYGGVPPFPETQSYISKVFDIRRRLNEGAGGS